MRLSSLCFLLALAAAPAAVAAPGDAAPPRVTAHDTETMRAWAADHVDADGWILIGSSSNGKVGLTWFVADQSAPGSKFPLMQEWIRAENASTPGSILTRWEIDCSARRSRELERVFYDANNLHGRATLVAEGDGGKWMTPPRDSIGDSVIKRVCRDAG